VRAALIEAAVFAYVPMLECRHCSDGLFACIVAENGYPVCSMHRCDCGSIFSNRKRRKERVSLLRGLQRPRPREMKD
jgi:hypothetical protein